MVTTFNELPEFSKEFHRLAKKYRSLPKDLEEFKRVLIIQPLGTGKHFNVITKADDAPILKARLFCRYLKGSSLRIIYAYHPKQTVIEFLEIYFKGDKENEDRKRIEEYIRGLKSSEMGQQEAEKLRKWILKGEYEIKTGGQYYIGVAIDLGMKTVPLYHMKNMIILKAPRDCVFVTSDFPILEVPDQNAPPMYQAGIMGSHIYFPIGSSTALLFVNPTEPTPFRDPLCLDRVPIRILDEASVRKWNVLMVADAEDAIFGASLDQNLQAQMNSSTKRKRIKVHSPFLTKWESLQVFQQEVVG